MRYRNVSASWLTILGLLLISRCVLADDWLPIDPAELSMKSEPKALGAPAIYLYRQVDRDDTESVEYVYYRIKILTEEGRKYADVEIPYDSNYEAVGFIHARTIRPDGTVTEFTGSSFDKPIVQGNGKRLMAATFTLSDVQVGGIVEYRYRHKLRSEYVYDSRWLLTDDLFTKHAKFSLIPSGYFYLRYAWPIGLPEGAVAPKRENGRIRMEVHDVPAIVAEEFMPPENELKYRVDFIYHNGENKEKDTDAFWKRFGKLTYKKVDDFTNESRAMKEALAKIVDASDSPEVKLNKIYACTQQIRNLSFERFKTEEERKRDTPKDVKDVADLWKRGYGDATQITWLFLALARAAGFDAEPVLVSARDQYFFNKVIMNENLLNSNLVIIKLGDQQLYLDPGIPYTPFGLLPWYETAVKGLNIDKNGGTWLDVPLSKAEQSRVTRKAELRLTEGGSLEGKVTVTYTGLLASSRRFSERNDDDVERKQFLEDELGRAIPVGIDAKLLNEPAWNSSDQALVAEYELHVSGWANRAGQQAFLTMGLFAQREKSMFKHAMRVHPVYFNYPNESEDDITISLPPGLRATSLPEAYSVGAKVLSYSTSVEQKDGVLRIRRLLSNNLLYLKSDLYPQIHDFFQQVRTHDEQQIAIAAGKAIGSAKTITK
jgi:Domain of Unknown Function with PDB structure (DUF3857)